VTAINKHQKVRTPEAAVELFNEFKKSVFLVGIILEKPLEENRPGETLFKKGDRFGVIQLKDAKDKNLLALFTDHAELQRWTEKANSTLVMPAKDAMKFVLDKNYDGLVVNPAGQNHLQLDTPFIKSVMKDM
jgi:SseB protein N-terminal domain